MPRNNALVDVGIRINTKDIDKILSNLAQEFNDLGTNINISDNFKKQIEDMVKQIEELQSKMTNLQKTNVSRVEFGNLKLDILGQISTLEQRTSMLESAMSGLVKTMSDVDGGNITSVMEQIRTNMDQASSSATGLINAIGTISSSAGRGVNVNIINDEALKSDITVLEDYKKRINILLKNDYEAKPIDIVDEDDFKRQFQIIIDEYNRLFAIFKKKPNDIGVISQLINLTERINDFDDYSLSNFDSESPMAQIISNVQQKLPGKLNRIREVVNGSIVAINRELGTLGSNPKYTPRGGSGGGYTIPIDVSTDSNTLANRVIKIIEAAQSRVDGNPIEVELQLISPYQTKKFNNALKDFQEQVGKIQNDKAKERMEAVLENIQKGFASQISVNLVSSISDAAKAMRFILADLKNELKNNPVVINPRLEFTDEEVANMQKQVSDVSKKLALKLSEAVKEGFVGKEEQSEEENKKNKKRSSETEFSKLEKQLSNIIDDINSIPKQLDETSSKMPEALQKAGQSLNELYVQFQKLDTLDMGQNQLHGLIDEIDKAKSSIQELLNLFEGDSGTKSSLDNMIHGWTNSDKDLIKARGKEHLRERSAVLGDDGKIYGEYAYDQRGSTNIKRHTVERMKSLGVKPSVGFHSHSDDRIALSSYGNDDLGGDIHAWVSQVKKGIEKQVTVALNDIEVFDAKEFYSNYSNIDFSSKDVAKKLNSAKIDAFSQIKQARTLFLEEFVNEYSSRFADGTAFEKGLRSFIVNSAGNYFGADNINIDGIIQDIRGKIGSKGINLVQILNDALTSNIKADKTKLNKYFSDVYNIKDIYKEWGIEGYSNRDVELYQFRKMTPEIFRNALGIDDFSKYMKYYKIDDFISENPLGLSDASFKSLFSSLSLDGFSDQLSQLIDPLKTISSIFASISEMPDGMLNLGLDDSSSIAKNIDSITSSLKEFIEIYKELNGLSTPGLSDLLQEYDKASYSATVKRDEESINKIQQLKQNYPNIFDTQSESYLGTFSMRTDSYTEWADKISVAAQRVGVSLRELGNVRSEVDLPKVAIDTDQFSELLQSTIAFKDALNNLGTGINFDDIVNPLQRIEGTLLEFSEVVQKSTGILSNSKLNEKFSKIRDAAQLLDGVKFNTKTGKEGANAIIDMYREYLDVGGTLPLTDIGGSKNLQKYLAKHFNETSNEGADSAQKEASALQEIAPAANMAAEAKTSFADANRELFNSIISSVAELDNEGKAFENINKLLNNLGGKNSDEKLNKTKSALEELITLLNTDIGENSLIKSLENMASTGDALKDLASVLRATKKQVEQAKSNVGIKSGESYSDYTQDKLNNDEEALQKAGRDYLSQFGLVLNSTLKKSRDGLLEYTGLVKNANNELKQFVFTSPDGKHFNIQSESTNTPQAMKQALQYEKIRKAWERMQAKDPNMTNEVVFRPDIIEKDKEAYEEMIGVAQSYINEIGNIQKVTRQVRQDSAGNLLESFSFHGDKGHITMGRDGGIVASHQDLENMEDVKVAYSELYNTAKNYYELKMKAASGKATPYEINQLQEIEKEYDSLLEKIDKFNKLYGGNNIGVDALNTYRNDIGKQFDDYLQKSQDTYDKRVKTVEQTRINQRNDYTPEYRAQLDEVVNLWERINELRDQHTDGKAWNIDELIEVGSKLQKIDQIYDGLKDKRNILAKTSDIDNLISKASRDLTQNSLSPDLAGRYRELISDLQQVRVSGEDAAQGLGQIDQVTLGRFQDRLKELNAELMRTGQSGKGFWKQFSGAITSKSANFLAQYFSLQDLIRYGREISQTVITIDSANTELKKVTDESNTRIQHSFTESAKTAQELGATISEVINSTADWARLGYNIDEAEELARVTTLYQTVGDNMSQETASQSLVSMLQGFHIDASEAERVVDSVNEVANNFAIDTAGIGEALQRSAAAFNAAGTDLNKSIALVTTANAVVQNPETVGKHLPT